MVLGQKGCISTDSLIISDWSVLLPDSSLSLDVHLCQFRFNVLEIVDQWEGICRPGSDYGHYIIALRPWRPQVQL